MTICARHSKKDGDTMYNEKSNTMASAKHNKLLHVVIQVFKKK